MHVFKTASLGPSAYQNVCKLLQDFTAVTLLLLAICLEAGSLALTYCSSHFSGLFNTKYVAVTCISTHSSRCLDVNLWLQVRVTGVKTTWPPAIFVVPAGTFDMCFHIFTANMEISLSRR
jgi:hypothetical protein